MCLFVCSLHTHVHARLLSTYFRTSDHAQPPCTSSRTSQELAATRFGWTAQQTNDFLGPVIEKCKRPLLQQPRITEYFERTCTVGEALHSCRTDIAIHHLQRLRAHVGAPDTQVWSGAAPPAQLETYRLQSPTNPPTLTRAVLKKPPFFLLGTALKNSPQGRQPPTAANRRQLPTTNRQPSK